MAEPLSAARRFAYALGHPGFQVTDRIVVLVAVYFYLPPPGRGLEPQVPAGVFWGVATVFGLAMFLGRVFDSLADVVVGHLSDRSRSPLGRRRALLLAGVVPMVGLPVLLFFPPGAPGSAANGIWLAALLAAYFVAFTVYVAPYLALLPEVAWTQPERLRLSQLMQLATIPVYALFVAWGAGLDLGRAAGLAPAAALRWIVCAASLLALALCLAPIFAVHEARHTRGSRSELPFREALALTLRNRPFLLYLAAQLFFVLSVNLFQPILPYLATVVLGRSEGFTAWFVLAMGAGIALGFALQRPLMARVGAKRLLMLCVGAAALALGALGGLSPAPPGSAQDRANLWLLFAALGAFGVPAAGLMVVPHVILSQLIDEDARRGGATRSAMFFGVQGLATKWMYGVSLWVFTWLLSRFGNSPETPLGVLLVSPVAGAFALLALALYALYPEREVLGRGGSRDTT
jgi:GPH family glycoside/pentoside/hexuronide:cation symporter